MRVSLGSSSSPAWKRHSASRTPRAVTWNASARQRGVRLRARSRVEYDGFWQVDLTVGPGRIRRLSLTLPLAARHARYLHFVNESHYQETNTRSLPKREGLLWSDRFACMVWVGDERVGLAWCADSDAPFRLRRPERALTLRRSGSTTTLTVTLIDHPIALKTPLRWRFGLVATPLRPLPPRRRDWRLAPGASANTHILWWNAWSGSHADPTPREPAALSKQAQRLRASGQFLLPYVALLALSERNSAYRQGGSRWRREPFSRLEDEGTPYWIICPNTPWQRYLPEQMTRLVRDLDVNGLYFDFTFPYRCEAAHHPCGQPQGARGRRGEFRVFATRRLSQAIYERVKSARPNSRILLHTSGALMYPYIGFGDLMLNGEQLRRPLMAAGGRYLDVLPLATLRAEYQGRHAGLAPFIIPELATPAGLPDPALTTAPGPTNELLALALLHDVGIWPIYCHLESVEAVRAAQRRFDTAASRFIPYWESGGPVLLNPPSLLASAWVRGDAQLIVVVNRGDRLTRASVRLRQGQRPLIAARDALDGRPIAVISGQLSLSVPPRGFRLLRLTARPYHRERN